MQELDLYLNQKEPHFVFIINVYMEWKDLKDVYAVKKIME